MSCIVKRCSPLGWWEKHTKEKHYKAETERDLQPLPNNFRQNTVFHLVEVKYSPPTLQLAGKLQ